MCNWVVIQLEENKIHKILKWILIKDFYDLF